MSVIPFSALDTADLIIDAVFEGGNYGNVKDDPLSHLLPCGNLGGFRFKGTQKTGYQIVILYSSLIDLDWPDNLDTETGIFTYYGDNKKPGKSLHNTPKGGNKLLRKCFESIHSNPSQRDKIPPFFVFTKAGKGRDVKFRGLAVPGSDVYHQNEDLVAIWKDSGGRFQNYRSIFTILDVPVISRKWIEELAIGNPLGQHCPDVWRKWVKTGKYDALKAQPSRQYRNKAQQIPTNKNQLDIVNIIYTHFKRRPTDFEGCAAELAQMRDPNIISYDLTRPWMDGGRDAIGKYRIGTGVHSSIQVDFALEAKCYDLNTGLGVKMTSRLISRLRHRQFGIFITTSYIALQAYKEIIEDGHPVVVISAKDIAETLIKTGKNTPQKVKKWLQNQFP